MNQESEFAFDTMQGPMALMVGMMGMSGSGKTESAIALATGMASVNGGPVVVIDTESGRARHKHKRNGGRFDFKHIDFDPDHSTVRYLAAINYAISQGAGAIVVDSYSHEHEGIGGALEQHAAELQSRFNGNEAMTGLAWAKPKRERKAVVNRLLQVCTPIVFCFRAKEGVDFNYIDPVKLKRTPRAEGLVPIGDRQFFYDMTVNFVFRAGCDGVPDWAPNIRTEPVTRYLAKCPGQFRKLLGYEGKPPQVNEELGVAMAKWAAGNDRGSTAAFTGFHQALTKASTLDVIRAVGTQIGKDTSLTEVDKNELRDLAASRVAELKATPSDAAAQ